MERVYYSDNFQVEDIESIKNELQKLLEKNLESVEDLENYIDKYNELSAIVEEAMAWKYIKMTRFADQEEYANDFNNFYGTIVAEFNRQSFHINKKIYDSSYISKLPEDRYKNYKLILKNDIEIFEEKNIPLQIEENELSNQYGEIISKITIDFQGESYTLSQMNRFLKDNDREIREKAWKKIYAAISEKRAELNELFNKLLKLRVQMAKNKNFDNYRDYMHKAKGRFSYTPEDLYKFHESVEKVIVPMLREINEKKRVKISLDTLRPWDKEASEDGKILKPFENEGELLEKGISALMDVKEEFGSKLRYMAEKEFLDLGNRKGKAPGGYNYPLSESGAAFIFMNAVGVQRDVVTLMHEAGHALHSFATKDERLMSYKETPSEVAELASMSMEFISMNKWKRFYKKENDFKKAQKEQIIGALQTFPWVMTVDAFQHWIYLNPEHTLEERDAKFEELMDRFNTGVNWLGLESEKSMTWLKQLHIFEVPFYYIEYAISQLGAIGIYKNYKQNPETTLAKYEEFLNLGYSKSIEEIYETAGIKFDFSEGYISELANFLKEELEDLD
ncbi:M3 family oligoendopeptidase [uncultured Ilyobacter sp.]|uniref:M3 family oligoendopeptidase n=1 Tax=uncultured Ilyobacter sp. TaxID=544433 RepID=UPI0029C01BC4|nr:M3 family oligoendopeptidase [uncultured Ilyobacter sp.]